MVDRHMQAFAGPARTWGLALLAALQLLASPASAQTYPSRFVRLIVPFGAAGSIDVTARLLAKPVAETWGQQIVIENKPGADADLGTEAVAKAAPDGYTLLLTSQALAVNASLRPGRPYKTSDLAPIALVASTQAVLVVPTTLPVSTVADLVALAKSQPGKLDFGSTGIGTSGHLACELFRLTAGIDMLHVPYRNIGQQMTDLIAGRTTMGMPTVPGAMAHIGGGRLKPLAVSGTARSPALPNVPTLAEAGLVGYEATTWYALFAPKGTASDIVSRLNAEFRAALARPDIAAKLAELGLEPRGGTPAELARHVEAETVRWARVVKEANIRAE